MDNKLQILATAGTSVIADIFDKMGKLPLVLDNDLFPIPGSTEARFAGPAYTITGEYHKWSEGPDREKLAAIDRMPKGVVSLWAGNDVKGLCLFGDLLAGVMKARGCRGIVVDGGVRDIVELRKLGIPILARYWSPAQSIYRWHVTGSQVTVHVRGALVEKVSVDPGDIIVVDQDGVVLVPQELLDAFVDAADSLASAESQARDDILAGMPLLEAIDKYGLL
jgi:4-hydroxy-4-methyl-2-oxoglutarate aldolase